MWEFHQCGKHYRPSQKLKRHVVQLVLEKKFFWLRGVVFFMSDVISRGLSGYLGQLHLALGPSCQMVEFC